MGLLSDPIFFKFDLPFLIIFTLGVILFIYRNRKYVKREMKIAFLYRTQVGVKILDRIAKKYHGIVGSLRYVIIGVGFILMVVVILILLWTVYDYVREPLIAETIQSPPVVLLIPYFPSIFGLDSFFPPFYFTYFIIVISVVLIVHEGFHGIFMRYAGVRIKSTGIAFFGPILGAFVEQDEKEMDKASKKNQMAILGAGVFANLIVAIIFFLIWIAMFSSVFMPSGALFNTYPSERINITDISRIGDVGLDNPTKQELLNVIDLINQSEEFEAEIVNPITELVKIEANGHTYLMSLSLLKQQVEQDLGFVLLYYDLPAIRHGMIGTITHVNGIEIKTQNDLAGVMAQFSPGDRIRVTTKYEDSFLFYDVTLGEVWSEPGTAKLGVSYRGLPSVKLDLISYLRLKNFGDRDAFLGDLLTEYRPSGPFMLFLYYLVFWMFVVNLLVALFNMLPFAIMDGGRFFYLTAWKLTKSEKIAKHAFKGIGYIILAALLLLILVWIIRVYII
jgi:membrane-associated protease RseP (regulator of RpoE activity)